MQDNATPDNPNWVVSERARLLTQLSILTAAAQVEVGKHSVGTKVRRPSRFGYARATIVGECDTNNVGTSASVNEVSLLRRLYATWTR